MRWLTKISNALIVTVLPCLQLHAQYDAYSDHCLLERSGLSFEKQYLDESFKHTDSVNAVYQYRSVFYKGIPCYKFTENELNETAEVSFVFRKHRKINTDGMDSVFFSDGLLSGCLVQKGLSGGFIFYYFKQGFLTEVLIYNRRKTRVNYFWDFSGLYDTINPFPACENINSFFEEVKYSGYWCIVESSGTTFYNFNTIPRAKKTPLFFWNYYKNRREHKRNMKMN